MTPAFIAYVRSIFEYCTPVWSPHNIGSINTLENVQRTFTRNIYRVCHLPNAPYDDRLQFLGLERLELKRLHADLCFMFKIAKNFVSCNIKYVLQFAIAVNTSSHRFKLTTLRCKKLVFSSSFINRIRPAWNALNDNCFYCNNMCSFKSKLKTVNFMKFMNSNV